VSADLQAIRAIEHLKYRYLRSLDLKLWDEFAGTLTDDVIATYGPRLTFTGREPVVEFLRNSLGPGIVTVHTCHHPELSVDGDIARGTWYLTDQVIAVEHRMMITGAAFYEDGYRREADGQWRIARTGYVRSYEATQRLDQSWRLTANRFEPAD
jgi:ketosteroid isomerase-like protein